jgi:hypothetical protein
MDDTHEFLRHTLATVAYRGRKAISNAPTGFSGFRISPTSRTPGEILAHICDLFDWGLSIAQGRQAWQNSSPQVWDQDVARFFDAVGELDEYLSRGSSLGCAAEQLFQAPIADALTHIGQIAMLRRIAGAPVRAENYFKADIVIGRVGPDQTAPRMEFD